jgi:NitT/TauT family transport system permease protein
VSAAQGVASPAGPSPAAAPRARRGYDVGRALREYVPAIVVIVGGLVLWELSIRLLKLNSFVLPAPSAIWSALVENWNGERFPLFESAKNTIVEAAGGFLIGTTAGVVVAFLAARWSSMRALLLPLAVAANAIPIIAFAPIFNAWFDPLAPTAKMAVAAVLCFFPVLVNTLRGLQSVRPQQIELMQSYAAGGVETFRRVRFPTALPYIFTSLKVASVLAMIGAVVGEYFGGSFNALGVLIRSRAQILDFNSAWAAILVACVFGIGFYAAVAVAERLVIRWAPEARDS